MTKAEERRAYLQAQKEAQPTTQNTVTKADMRRLQTKQAQTIAPTLLNNAAYGYIAQTHPEVIQATQHANKAIQGHNQLSTKQTSQVVQPASKPITEKIQNGGNITTKDEAIQFLREQGVSEKDIEYGIGRLEALHDNKAPAGKMMSEQRAINALPVNRYDRSYGKAEGIEESKKTSTVTGQEYFEHQEKLEEAQKNNDIRNISKYQEIVKADKEKLRNEYTEAPGDVVKLRKSITPDLQELNSLKAQFEMTDDNKKKAEIADQYRMLYNKVESKREAYANALAYDEAVNDNMASDIGRSFYKNVLGGTARTINSAEALAQRATGLDASTVNANSLINYIKGEGLSVSDRLKNATRQTLGSLIPGGSLVTTAQSVLSEPQMAYNQLATIHAANPNNQRLNKLFEQITNKTYQGTAEDLAKELDKIQKELYQEFKDKYTQDELDLVEEQRRHNEAIYKNNAWLPNAFGTVGDMVFPTLVGTATGGIGEAVGGGTMATAGTAANNAWQAGLYGTIGLSSGSAGLDQALANGASYNDAFNYGVLKGLTEAGTEKLGGEAVLGWFGQHGKTALGKVFGRAVDSLGIENKVGRFLANQATSVASEVVEEMISEAVDPLWQVITYNPDALPKNLEEIGQYFKNILNAGVEAIPSTLIMQGSGLGMNVMRVQTVENGLINSIQKNSNLSDIAKTQLINEVKKASNEVKAEINKHYGDTIAENIKGTMLNNMIDNTKPIQTAAQPTTQAIQNIETPKAEPVEPTSSKITAGQPLDTIRDFKEVGNKAVNAYQYDNPEVKPFFQHEAKNMLMDLNNVIKGERTATYNEYGELKYTGTKRDTTKDIAELLDGDNGVKLSYDDIRKGLNAIINDQGSENIAAAKRIEMILDRRLREGYVDSFGTEYEPNENYKNFLEGKDWIDPDEYERKLAEKMIAEENGIQPTQVEQPQELSQAPAPELETSEMPTVEDMLPTTEELTQTPEKEMLPTAEELKLQTETEMMPTTEELNELDKQRMADEAKALNLGGNRPPEPPTQGSTEPPDKTKKRSYPGTVRKNKELSSGMEIKDMEYVPQSNKKTLDYAQKQIDKLGYDEAVKYINNKVALNEHISLDDIAMGELLIQKAKALNDLDTAQDLIADVAILGTDLGQAVQALSLINRLTPEGQLKYLDKVVNRINTKIDNQNSKKPDNKKIGNIKLSKEKAQKILEAKDDAELQAAMDEALQEVADQMPVTLGDKVAEWRYLAMLANPRTHIRNTVANVAMKGTYKAKNIVSRSLETIASPLLEERTRTFEKATDDVKKFAEQSVKENAEMLSGGNNKTIEARLKEMRQVFKNEKLEKLRIFNKNALSWEDDIFTQSAYKDNLEEYLTANGIKTEQDILDKPEIVQKGIQFAAQEAWKTTFHQFSQMATAINKLENQNVWTKMFIGGTIPFKKTPINIAKTGVQYSPLGLLETLSVETAKLKNGSITANEYIDRISQGLTGTAILAIGALLAKFGILKGSTEGKEEEYQANIGQTKAYSLRIGNKNFDISWLSPAAMPLLMGAELVNAAEDKGASLGELLETLEKTINPLNEMSFMSGVNSTLQSYNNSNTGLGLISGVAENALKSYFGQMIPTIGGQINKIIDPTQRVTTASKNSPWRAGESYFRQQLNKIPGGSYLLEPKTDVWGNEVKRDDSPIVRAMEALINPGTVTRDTSTEVDDNIMALFQETGNEDIIPKTPTNYYTKNNNKYEMSAKEYTQFKKDYGQKAYKDIEELMDSDEYKEADSAEKAKQIKNVYNEARDYAKDHFEENRYSTQSFIDPIYNELEKNSTYTKGYHVGEEGQEKIKEKIKDDSVLVGKKEAGIEDKEVSQFADTVSKLEEADIPLADYYLAWLQYDKVKNKGKQVKKTYISNAVDLDTNQKKVLYEIFNVE